MQALQAATNVALDLDDRPMPKIITLPRRRRRRVPGAPGAAGAAATTAASGAPASDAIGGVDTAGANIAAVVAAERAAGNGASANRNAMERMLAEDQAAATAS